MVLDMKMSDVFKLPVTAKLKFTGDKSNELTPDVILIDGHYTLNGTECNAVENAINNHDKLVESLREVIDLSKLPREHKEARERASKLLADLENYDE